jgi:nucleobase:cation symporter-1, NCS1 family
MFTVVVATLSVNIAANVVSPANDFANAFPRFITFSRGGLLAGIIGILMQPWRLLADPSGYIFDWLLGYSGGLGSIAGVLIADYWILRRSDLAVDDLYREDGIYGRWQWGGIAATILGCIAAWIGLVVPPLRPLYDYAWFVGFGVSFAAHLVLARRTMAVESLNAAE